MIAEFEFTPKDINTDKLDLAIRTLTPNIGGLTLSGKSEITMSRCRIIGLDGNSLTVTAKQYSQIQTIIANHTVN